MDDHNVPEANQNPSTKDGPPFGKQAFTTLTDMMKSSERLADLVEKAIEENIVKVHFKKEGLQPTDLPLFLI